MKIEKARVSPATLRTVEKRVCRLKRMRLIFLLRLAFKSIRKFKPVPPDVQGPEVFPHTISLIFRANPLLPGSFFYLFLLLQIKHAQNDLPPPEIILHQRGNVHRLVVGFQPVDAVSAWPDGDDVLRADIVDIETGGSPPHT